MNPTTTPDRPSATREFATLIDKISDIGKARHADALLEHALANADKIKKTLKDLPKLTGEKARSGIVISAGPSVRKKNAIQKIRDSKYPGTLVAVDGSYIACLKQGLIPDYVVSLDPHKTRIVRWFGDPDFEENTKNDDYFTRQDLDVDFRKNSIRQNNENIELVNKYGHLTKAVVSSSAPANVVRRLAEAKFDTYWWHPLVDDPKQPGSITRSLYDAIKLPCMNTGGTVGTASWVLASSILKLPEVAVVGMDLGYFHDTPIEMTQTYYELIDYLGGKDELRKYFCDYVFPLTGEKFFTDPTYYWYRRNFLQLHEKATNITYNCTEGGTLFDEKLKCITLDEFLRAHDIY